MDKDFLSFLVEETMKLQESGKMGLSFERKLNDYGLGFLKGKIVPQTQLLHFKTSFGNLDVPCNWTIFSNPHSLLDENNDEDKFLSILKLAWNPAIEKLLIIHADGHCYLVGLKAEEEGFLHDLLHPQEWLKSA